MSTVSGVMYNGKFIPMDEAKKRGLLAPEPVPLSEEELAKSREAETKLSELSKGMTEEQRLAYLQEHTHRKHRYRGVSKKSKKTHEFDHHYPTLSHVVVITDKEGNEVHNVTDSEERAHIVHKNALMSKEEHLAIIEDHQRRILSADREYVQESKRQIELHKKWAEEAEGKTAEVIALEKVESK